MPNEFTIMLLLILKRYSYKRYSWPSLEGCSSSLDTVPQGGGTVLVRRDREVFSLSTVPSSSPVPILVSVTYFDCYVPAGFLAREMMEN